MISRMPASGWPRYAAIAWRMAVPMAVLDLSIASGCVAGWALPTVGEVVGGAHPTG